MTDYFTKRTPAEVDEEDEDFSEEDESALPTPLTQLPVTGESNIPADPPSEPDVGAHPITGNVVLNYFQITAPKQLFIMNSEAEEQHLLVRAPLMDDFPTIILPKGLDAKRQWYLYDEIRQFAGESKQDLVTPLPLVPKPGRVIAADSNIGEESADPQPSV
ncbi:hypothetical protein RRG08_052526 [Elysia crispata]|uniref:Uncharacterized protein n=1 Tax=Elysia crispata TaxID=231223 RepID=A0AAE0Y820_9GAST|nr:hypothetical protein RRG08_052526 [Elysia crispata]